MYVVYIFLTEKTLFSPKKVNFFACSMCKVIHRHNIHIHTSKLFSITNVGKNSRLNNCAKNVVYSKKSFIKREFFLKKGNVLKCLLFIYMHALNLLQKKKKSFCLIVLLLFLLWLKQ